MPQTRQLFPRQRKSLWMTLTAAMCQEPTFGTPVSPICVRPAAGERPRRLHRDTRRPGLLAPRHHDRTSILDISQRSKTRPRTRLMTRSLRIRNGFHPASFRSWATEFRSNFDSGIAVSFSACWPFATARTRGGRYSSPATPTRPAPSRGTEPNAPRSRLHERNPLTVSRIAKYA